VKRIESELDGYRSQILDVAGQSRAAGGLDPLRFGIGLHVGPVTFGNIGTEDRLDFTGSIPILACHLDSLTTYGPHAEIWWRFGCIPSRRLMS